MLSIVANFLQFMSIELQLKGFYMIAIALINGGFNWEKNWLMIQERFSSLFLMGLKLRKIVFLKVNLTMPQKDCLNFILKIFEGLIDKYIFS
jgi:hypothetical protein